MFTDVKLGNERNARQGMGEMLRSQPTLVQEASSYLYLRKVDDEDSHVGEVDVPAPERHRFLRRIPSSTACAGLPALIGYHTSVCRLTPQLRLTTRETGRVASALPNP
jgi:hypothetical protein